jgi:hypothetical protein
MNFFIFSKDLFYLFILSMCPVQAGSEEVNNSYSFLASALDGVSGQRHAPAAF